MTGTANAAWRRFSKDGLLSGMLVMIIHAGGDSVFGGRGPALGSSSTISISGAVVRAFFTPVLSKVFSEAIIILNTGDMVYHSILSSLIYNSGRGKIIVVWGQFLSSLRGAISFLIVIAGSLVNVVFLIDAHSDEAFSF